MSDSTSSYKEDYCNCVEFCYRMGFGFDEKNNERYGFYVPYLPEIAGGPKPYCKSVDGIEVMKPTNLSEIK